MTNILYSVGAVVDGILRVAMDYPAAIVLIVGPLVLIVLGVRLLGNIFAPRSIKVIVPATNYSEMSAADRKVSPGK